MMHLFQTHGTTLCGLVREGHLKEDQVDEFLAQVHDVHLDISPDPQLREMLLSLPRRRWVFTAATREHAERCLEKLGIQDLFLGIVACSSPEMIRKVGYVSKHDPRCFHAAMEFAGMPRDQANACVLLDDSVRNLKTARAVGWRAVLVGLHARDGSAISCPEADVAVNTLHEIPMAVPGLFKSVAGKDFPSFCILKGMSKLQDKICSEVIVAGPERKRQRQLKPLDFFSPARRVLRRVSTPLSPRTSTA